MADIINHPPHYTITRVECIEIIEDQGWGLAYCLGAAMKYLWRCQHKGRMLEDLRKCRWYVDRAIKAMEAKESAHDQG
jgi:hypothetical protein